MPVRFDDEAATFTNACSSSANPLGLVDLGELSVDIDALLDQLAANGQPTPSTDPYPL